MTIQEAKVSTFFLTVPAIGMLVGGMVRFFATFHVELGSVLCMVFGGLLMVATVLHIGLND